VKRTSFARAGSFAVGENMQFQAKIYKIWMMRHVDVPEEIGRALAKACRDRPRPSGAEAQPKFIPVISIVNGKSSRTTLVPAGAARYRLQINTGQRKAAGADAGDLIGVSLEIDREPREIEVPSDLRAALKDRPKIKKTFQEMGPGQRRQLLLYLERAKSQRVRDRVIARFMEILRERALLGRRAKVNLKKRKAARRA